MDTVQAAQSEAGSRRWHVRPAHATDAEACAALAVIAWQRVHDSYAAILGADLHDRLFSGWEEAKAKAVARVVREQPERAMIAIAGEQVVGFVTFHADVVRQVGEIGNNAVDPSWQGQGIATALYRAALAELRTAGMKAARVTTGLDDGHAPARAAYAKVGFDVGLPSVTYFQDL